MERQELIKKIDQLLAKLTPDYIKAKYQELLKKEGEELGGGINAKHFVQHLLGIPEMRDTELMWAYDRIKHALYELLEQIPSLYYFDGD